MKIVCLCGSTKFKQEFLDVMDKEERKGNIVLSIGSFTHADNIDISDKVKEELDILHLMKIDIADEILVIDKDGYKGESTTREILYALKLDKDIRYYSIEYK